ncbi:GNAT family acetyltransferase [Natronomonas moolapensis 8.8.11]|uniref:GNAT family acetyltransferase n=1 Tax=Natronomonas moolapensis (strain DSM 18674 / CECT 7526 / JCM 14361 / 8.8.11) TaxID=268739 RepID=M1Y1D3_NATM8|nr:GNAT family N-acetyltransferase [Natronomonas moolapensis]CCQ36289.1 GNAT family acetyltransferase [Natronomonas moolapensis 8.8.11]
MTREYPDDVAGPYEAPPYEFEDREGRVIEVERYDDGIEPLLEMYAAFDPEDRAQGIPPTNEDQIRTWLETLVEADALNVIAWHGEAPIGHAMLVPDDGGSFELAIFVLREYQNAGIGTGLIEGLLGAGREDGVERVWLSVERWNKPAITLYRKVGFRPTDDGSFELEMSARLTSDA